MSDLSDEDKRVLEALRYYNDPYRIYPKLWPGWIIIGFEDTLEAITWEDAYNWYRYALKLIEWYGCRGEDITLQKAMRETYSTRNKRWVRP